MKLLIFTMMAFYAQSLTANSKNEVTESFKSKGIKVLRVDNISGDIRISGKKNAARIEVTAEKIKFDDVCRLRIRQRGDVLIAEVQRREKRGLLIECRVDFSIDLASSVEVKVMSGAGDLIVDGMTSELDFKLGSGNAVIRKSVLSEVDGKSGSGDVAVQGEIKELDISLGSGDVIAEGSFRELYIKTGSGNVEVILDKAPMSGDMDLKSGVGDITVKLPKGSQLESRMISGLGDETNDFTSDKSSEFHVKMVSGMGDLSIQKM